MAVTGWAVKWWTGDMMASTKTHDAPAYVAAANSKKVNLALQGGGAHGAFAWGVLDRLLEDGRVVFDAVSATSAGAMNATVLGYGLTIGGAEGAREELEKFWKKISDEGAKGPLQPSWILHPPSHPSQLHRPKPAK